MKDGMKKTTASSSSSIEYPPRPHSILPNKVLSEFIHNPIKMLMDIAYTYGDIAHFKVVFDGYCTLGEILKQVEEFYAHSYGHDFELTR